MNDDLLKHPFDQELKDLTTRFGYLLRSIIAIVDRFGLKARYLARHKAGVDDFIEKLFTFLNYDGIL
jgi:hypothetical protein